MILSPHPLRRYIFDEARDQPQPGSLPKKDPGYEVDGFAAYKYGEWNTRTTTNLSGIPPFSHALFKAHLITDYSSKLGKLPNVHKHKEHGYQLLIKDKVVTQVVVKSNVLKGTEKFYLLMIIVHAYGLEPMFT